MVGDKKPIRITFILTSAILCFLYFVFNIEKDYKTIEFILTPQGYGKTTIGIIFIKLLKHFGFINGKTVNIIVPPRELRKQWYNRLCDVFEKSNIAENEILEVAIGWKINILTIKKLYGIDIDPLDINKHLFIFDQGEKATKDSALGFLLSRYVRKNKKLLSAKLFLFIIPSSEERGRIKILKRAFKEIDPTTNPLCLTTNLNLFDYEIEKIELTNQLRSDLYSALHERRKKIKQKILNLIKKYKLPIKKFDRLTPEDIEKIKVILKKEELNEEEIEKITSQIISLFKIYKLMGWQIQQAIVSSVREFNILNSKNIKINNSPLAEFSESEELFKKVVEIISKQNYNEKILIYSTYVKDLNLLKEEIEKNIGEKVSINSKKSRIAIISDKNASGVDWSEYTIFILCRYPRKSFSKLADIIGRPRGAKLYFIYWDFERDLMNKILKRVEKYFQIRKFQGDENDRNNKNL